MFYLENVVLSTDLCCTEKWCREMLLIRFCATYKTIPICGYKSCIFCKILRIWIPSSSPYRFGLFNDLFDFLLFEMGMNSSC